MIRASVIGYMPIIAASPTELSTVYELLKRSVSLAGEIQQQSIIVVLDQAIYALAQEIIFTHAQEFKQVVLRLGGFHMSMTMMSDWEALYRLRPGIDFSGVWCRWPNCSSWCHVWKAL